MSLSPTAPLPTISLPFALDPIGSGTHVLTITVLDVCRRGGQLCVALKAESAGCQEHDTVALGVAAKRAEMAQKLAASSGVAADEIAATLAMAYELAGYYSRQPRGTPRAPLRVLRPGERDEGEPLTRVSTAVPGAPVDDAAVVPMGYRLDLSGTIRLSFDATGMPIEERLLSVPLLIAQRHHDLETEREMVTVRWLRDGRWQSETVGRGQIADARAILQLADQGLPVTSNTSREVVRYLDQYDAANPTIPLERATSSCGWKTVDGTEVFMLGATMIADADAPRITFRSDDAENRSHVAAIHSRGSFAAWREGILPVLAYPPIVTVLATAVAAPFLHLLGTPNFGVDLAGDSSMGKTTAHWIGASVFGMADGARGGLVKNWDSTRVAVERLATLLNGLPLFLDDSQLANERYLPEAVYGIINGRSRNRGSPSGLRASASWHVTLISNGEHPIIGSTQNHGIRGRIATLGGSPFGGTNQAETVRAVRAAVEANYGHAGEMLLWMIHHHRDRWETWRADYAGWVAHYTRLEPTNLGSRHAQGFAAMTVALSLALEAWEIDFDPCPALEAIFGAAMRQIREDGDYGERALDLVLSWARSNYPNRFFVPHARSIYGDAPTMPTNALGIWNEDQGDLSFFPHQFNAFLEEHGFSSGAVLQTWRDKGWLKVGKTGLHWNRECDKIQTKTVTICEELIKQRMVSQPGEE